MRDRYAIYELQGKVVKFRLPPRLGGKTVFGIVERVYRDPLAGVIEFRIKGRKHTVKEPFAIEKEEDGSLIFVYGDDTPMTDAELIAEAKEQAHKGKGMEAAFKAAEKHEFRVRFNVSEHVARKGVARKQRKTKKK